MRALLWVLVLAACGWAGYWFIGARAMERGAESWFAAQAGAGLIAERGELSVQGFPNRFDLTVTDPDILNPTTGFGWTAPFVQVFSLSYKPWHVIAALPNTQTIQTPLQRFELTSDKMQGSLVVTPGLRPVLDRTTLVGDALRLTSSLGWAAGADTLRLATRTTQPGGQVHEVGAELLGLVPDPSVSAALPDLPPRVDRMRVDAQVELAAPVSLTDGGDPPHPVRIDLREALVTWGDLALFGKGSVTADADGLAEGRIDLRLTNWRKAVPVAVALGLVTPEVAPTWENVFAVLAEQSASPDDLDLPLVFQRGRMSLGPLPLGPAPRMR